MAPAPAAAPAPEPAAMPAPMSPPASVQANETWTPTSAQGQSTVYGAPTSAYGQNPGFGAPAPAPWELAQGQVPGGDLDGAPLGFGAAIASAFRNYVTFRGRASRSAYWWFAVFQWIVELPFAFWVLPTFAANVGAAASTTGGSAPVTGGLPLVLLDLLGLAFFLPSLAVAIRRLHDCNRSGWYYFMAFIPLVGPLILLIFYVQQGTQGPNQYSLSSGSGGNQPQATWR